jgi:hypothetical protein
MHLLQDTDQPNGLIARALSLANFKSYHNLQLFPNVVNGNLIDEIEL